MVCASVMSLTAQKNLKTEHLVSPLGIDNNAPRLSWQTLGGSCGKGKRVEHGRCGD